jgi:hypothetical protein
MNTTFFRRKNTTNTPIESSRARVVIHTRDINIGHFLVEPPLTEAYFTDLCQQPFKVAPTRKAAILDPLVAQQ